VLDYVERQEVGFVAAALGWVEVDVVVETQQACE